MIAELVYNGVREMLDGLQNPGRWLVEWASDGQETSSGEAINEANAINCPAVKAAVSLLSEAFAVSTIEICEEKGPGVVEVIHDHPLVPILNRQPNGETNENTWWDVMQNNHGTYGNAYAFIQRTIRGNRTVALWNRNARPERTKPVRQIADGKIYYECHDKNGALEAMVPAADMLHVRYMSTDGILGKSPVKLIREAIGGNKAAERFANEIFKNGDATAGYFTHPGHLSETAKARIDKSLGKKSQHGDRHRKQVLEEGMTFKETNYLPEQMQMTEVRQYLDIVVAWAYRCNPQLLHMMAAGQMPFPDLMQEFITITLPFWGHRWTAEIDSKLLDPPFFCRWNFAAFQRNNKQAMAIEHRTNFSIGKQSINEMRHERGDNRLADPNADEHYVPMNMVPLSLANDFAKTMIAKDKTPDAQPGGGNPGESAPGGIPGSDGVIPTAPGENPNGRPPKEEGGLAADHIGTQLALIEAESVVSETLARFGRMEANEAMRAAKDPKTFLSRLDTFYAAHAEKLREALAHPVRAVVLLRDGPLAGGVTTDIEIDNTINDHVGGKRAALLTASECRPSELAERVTQAVREW